MARISVCFLIPILGLFFLLQACGSSQSMALNSVERTNQLRPGMSYDEVEQLLGKPKSSQMMGKQWVVRWKLQEMWKGYVPYDMIFNPDTQTLVSWSANEEDYEKSQARMGALAKTIEESSASAGSGGSGGNASPTGPNDSQLMQQFAGTYYSFSAVGGGQTGGTETTVTLCPDGSFYDSSETGYSGGAGTSGAWGSASQGGGRGTWRIVGNMNEGTLTTVSASGSATEYKFSRCGNDCVYFGNNKFAYAGPPNCR